MPDYPSTWLHRRYHATNRVHYTGPDSTFKTGLEVLDEERKRELSRHRRRQKAQTVLYQDTDGANIIGG